MIPNSAFAMLGNALSPKDEALLRLRQSLNCNINRFMQRHWAISICPVPEEAAAQIQETVTHVTHEPRV